MFAAVVGFAGPIAAPSFAPFRAPLARAAGPDASLEQAKDAYEKGQTAYNLGKFEEALRLYERAYEIKPLPALLFNIGQCHRNLDHWERAAFFYEGYLRGEPKAKNRPSVESLIAQMNAKVEEDRRRRNAVAMAPVQAPASPQPAAVTEAPVQNAGANLANAGAAASDKPSTPVYKRWYVWTIFGLVAAGGVATGVGVAAANPSTDYENLNGSLGLIGGTPDAR